MHKKILSEQALYYGDVSMPKGWDIDREKLQQDILQSNLTDSEFPFSRTWDMLNTYVRDHINLEYHLSLINKNTHGSFFKPETISSPIMNYDAVDLRNSPDFTMLYGVHVKNCSVKIFYDDNRRKGRSWDIPLIDNKFIMFPTTNSYIIENNQKEILNFVQFISYEYI